MNPLQSFFRSKQLVLDKSGASCPADGATGSYFYCKEATARFQMRFNNIDWFEFDESFYFNLGDEIFTKLEFRAMPGAAQDITILFYIASKEVGAHLNVIRNPTNFQSFKYFAANTVCKGFSAASIDGGSNFIFYGTGGSGVGQAGAAYAYRKSIVITNNDPGSDLEIYKLVGSGAIIRQNGSGDPGGVGTYTYMTGATLVRLATVFHGQAWTVETDDALIVMNETGAAINCRIMEIFYPAV